MYSLRRASFWAHLGPILGYLGPSLARLGGPGGHLGAYFGLGRLDLGVQDGQQLKCQKHQKPQEDQGFWPISGSQELQENLQSGCLEVLLWS